VESHDAGDRLAKVVPPLAAGWAGPAGQGAVHHHRLARREFRHVRPERGDLARGLGANHERQPALGEGHAAKAPDVDVVEPDGPHADLDLTRAGRRRGVDVVETEVAVAVE
jgi:hypothetical protein